MNAHFQYGYSNDILEVKDEFKPQNKIWSDEIASRLIDRNIKLINAEQEKYIKMRNRTIMDYAVEYLGSKEMDMKLLAPLNHVRLWKQIILPCKLVGLIGIKETKAYRRIESKSSIK